MTRTLMLLPALLALAVTAQAGASLERTSPPDGGLGVVVKFRAGTPLPRVAQILETFKAIPLPQPLTFRVAYSGQETLQSTAWRLRQFPEVRVAEADQGPPGRPLSPEEAARVKQRFPDIPTGPPCM